MKWNRVVVKLGGTIILLFLVVLLSMGFVVNQVFTGFYYKNTQENISQLSNRYAKALSDRAANAQMIMMMAEFSQVNSIIVNNDGKIIASSDLQSIPADFYVSYVDLKPLFEGKSVGLEYQDRTTGKRFMVSGSPVTIDSDIIGGVFVLTSIEGLHQSLQQVRTMLILAGIGAFFLALGFTFVLSKKLSDPLIQMQRATKEIAKGNMDTRVPVHSGDEIGLLARSVNEMAVDLKTYRDTRNEFFANVSHDLRTPITYVEGYAHALKNKMYQNETDKEQYLDLIVQESKRLTFLINDLFELSTMEEGKLSFEFEWIDITEVMENVLSKSKIKAVEKGLLITSDFDEGLPLLFSDGLRLEQIFTNLIDNAIRYTNEGSIHIEIENKDNDYVKVVIEDTGIGIPESELQHIFERFYRVEKSRSRDYGGTGLGLAIVKKLVELLGGIIRVYSQFDHGTRFEIDFPIVDGGTDK